MFSRELGWAVLIGCVVSVVVVVVIDRLCDGGAEVVDFESR